MVGLAGPHQTCWGTWPGSTAGRPGTAMPAGLEGSREGSSTPLSLVSLTYDMLQDKEGTLKYMLEETYDQREQKLTNLK